MVATSGDPTSNLFKIWTGNWGQSCLVGQSAHAHLLAHLLPCRKGEFAPLQELNLGSSYSLLPGY